MISRRHILILLPAVLLSLSAYCQTRDSERLGMALEYFTSAKYHEALLIFERLDKQYKLNDRFHAYMGVCYFHEWEYAKACQYLEAAMPSLEVFAPHERSVYYYTNAESHFQQEHYAEAIPYYERTLGVCYDNEKPHLHYRLGFCYMFLKNWEYAATHFRQSLSYYERFNQLEEARARIPQVKNMLKGCEHELRQIALANMTEMGDSIIRDEIHRDTLQNDSVYTIDLRQLYEQKIEVGE